MKVSDFQKKKSDFLQNAMIWPLAREFSSKQSYHGISVQLVGYCQLGKGFPIQWQKPSSPEEGRRGGKRDRRRRKLGDG